MKLGKFIAECRKQQNLTQMQLTEKLGITDKANSKWERGIAMPDSSIMLELCFRYQRKSIVMWRENQYVHQSKK